MSNLRIEKPLSKRYGQGQIARRSEKRQDRATFRQQTISNFQDAGRGLRVMDAAIVGVYEQFSSFKWLQYAVDIALIAAVLYGAKVFNPVYVVVAAGLSYIPLVYAVYKQAHRARNAREEALLAALEQQRRNGVAPPPQHPQPEVTTDA